MILKVVVILSTLLSLNFYVVTAYAQADIEDVLGDEQPMSPEEEQKFLQEEYSPPHEAPYIMETDPVTGENVPLPPQEEPAAIAIEPSSHGSSIPATPYKAYDGLKKVTAKGEYIYNVEQSPQSYGFSFRVGPFSPPDLANVTDSDTILFSDIYGDSNNMMFMFDFEWQLFKGAGKLALKAGSGFYTASGNGRFARDHTEIAREEYTFYLMPNNIGVVYRFDYFHNQPLVPYVFGGGNYFTFVESRDDNIPLKYGGALAAHFGGGIALLLDFLDPKAINQMDSDFGINHIYLTAEYTNIVGLNDTFDFSNEIISGGVLVEF